jgi:hypothetical protein
MFSVMPLQSHGYCASLPLNLRSHVLLLAAGTPVSSSLNAGHNFLSSSIGNPDEKFAHDNCIFAHCVRYSSLRTAPTGENSNPPRQKEDTVGIPRYQARVGFSSFVDPIIFVGGDSS